MSELVIRPAEPADAERILGFIRELAIYEKAEHEVVATVDAIRERLFGAGATVHALMAEVQDEPVGFAVYFLNFSTWLGRHGIFLEDLYITPSARGQGHATRLLRHLARMAVEHGYGRFEWNVLDWNAPAIAFYESIGATPQSEWIGYRLEGERLKAFASGA
ncbi:GNAT family N-acetyltransferase [Salinisphaera sp. LB1]|uniref:GNAT family N-acetyltransferase n=1 Tax=Salinisphaera sp. LB1 TaxID=2183911 RepID=UPI000D707AAB|nr:GNAT family N-acetyltransferase [Salinisphaera sp. LB1]AWN15838.1 GCN5-related N-acetyltransferase [Salinisphaera sp. LB1]